MPHQFIVIIIAAAALLIIGGVSFLSGQTSRSNIKAKPVGNGQHGTVRWATPKEISKTFHYVPFRPAEWRKGENRPKVQGLVSMASEKCTTPAATSSKSSGRR